MKRTVLIGVAISALFGSVDAGAGSRKPRMETATYGSAGGPGWVYPTLGDCTGSQYRENCVFFDVMRGERFLEIALDDAVGTSVSAAAYQRRGPDRGLAAIDYICGKTDEPLPLDKSTVEILVLVYQGPCSDLTPAVATTGTVTATFTSRR